MTGGPVWLKATGGGTRFEVRLYELLERVVPERVLTPLATDTGRGWILLPDPGRSVGEALRDDALLDALLTILPQYDQLQRAHAPQADEMVAFGVPDMRPAIMPQRFDEALASIGDYVEGRDDQADRETYRQVAALREPFQR